MTEFHPKIAEFLDEKIQKYLIEGTTVGASGGGAKVKKESETKDLVEKKEFIRLSHFYFNQNQFKESLEALDLAIAAKQTLSSDQSTLWAKLTLSLLLKDYTVALDSLMALKPSLDAGTNQKQVLYARTWWIHHSLLLIPHAGPKLHLIGETYYAWVNVLETTCPYILPHLAYIYILSAHKYTHAQIKEVAGAVASNAHLYSDNVTKLLTTAVTLDFTDATKALKDVVGKDMFMQNDKDGFMKLARGFVFTYYIRIHQKISFESVAKLLTLSVGEVGKWVERFVEERSSANEEFKISVDASAKTVLVKVARVRLAEEVGSKCKSLNDRAAAFEKLAV